MNNKSDKILNKLSKKNSKKDVIHKISPVKNRSLSSKNVFPHDSSYINNKIKNNSNQDENVIANILKANNIQNNEDEKFNDKIKYIKKSSSSSIKKLNEFRDMGDFNFINISQKVKPFLYQYKQTSEYSSHAFNNFNFIDISNNYRMVINILVDDDSFHSSEDLLKIFESVILSLNSLGEINISNKDILVCIFFQHFSCEETFGEIFPGLNFYNCNNWNQKMNTFYCSFGDVLSVNDTPISVLSFYKESATFFEANKFFYCNVLNDLIDMINVDPKEIGKTFLMVNWSNGKIYEKSSNKYHKSRILSNIFRIANNRNMILIPDINYYPCGKKDYFGYLKKYNFDADKIYVNLMWDMMSGYPIDHRFFFINMNHKLFSTIKEYYQNEVDIYTNKYYHDYNLTIFLMKNIKNISIQKIQQVKIEYSDLPSGFISFFYDYQLRKGSEYANFFILFLYFFSCTNMTFSKLLQKFTIIFRLVCFFIQFFWLGLSLLISYAVFNETYGKKSKYMDYFGSMGYVIIVLLLLYISSVFIKNKPKIKGNKLYRNLERDRDSYVVLIFLYIIHYAYTIFFLISSIISVTNVDEEKNEPNDYYIFKKKYFIILLILIALFMIIPIFIRPSNLATKGFLFYILLQMVTSPTYFTFPYSFTCVRNISSAKKNYESLYISLYIILNGLLTIMCLIFDTKRKRRIYFFQIISIIFCIFSGIKMIILILGVCIQNKFNKKISAGQIPQYNIENSEYNKNLDENENAFNPINNRNKMDDLNIQKNESKLPIKDNAMDNNDVKKSGVEKDFSSQMDIIPTNHLFLNESFDNNDKNKIKDNDNNLLKSEKLKRNYPILNFDGDNNEQINPINDVKKDLFNDQDLNHDNNINNSDNINNKINLNNREYIEGIGKDLNQNNSIYNNNSRERIYINSGDLKGISYPFDAETINDENNNNEYNLGYNDNYVIENNNYNNDNYNNNCVMNINEIDNENQNQNRNNFQEFALEQNDIFYDENNN